MSEGYVLINGKRFDIEKHTIFSTHLELIIMHSPDDDLEMYRRMRIDEDREPVANEVVLVEHDKTTTWENSPLSGANIDFDTYRVKLRFAI